MMGEQEAVVLEVAPLAIHGQPYVDVTLGFEDRSTDRSRLGPESIPDGPKGLVRYVKALAQTMMEAHDRLYVEGANYARTIPIPTLGVGTTAFNLSPERKLALYDSGRFAAEAFLKEWDFDAYVAAFRSGRQHSRRKVLAEAIAGSTAPVA